MRGFKVQSVFERPNGRAALYLRGPASIHARKTLGRAGSRVSRAMRVAEVRSTSSPSKDGDKSQTAAAFLVLNGLQGTSGPAT